VAFDPDYAKVALLLHMDGANGSTTFTDNSPTPKTVTAYGGAQISTADPIFGSGSGLFDGSNAYLQIADSADWAFGSGLFTVELFVRFASVSGIQRIIGQSDSGSTDLGWQVQKNSSNVIVANGGGSFPTLFGTTAVTAGPRYHVALTGDGATARLFVNGVLEVSGAYTSVADSASVLGIGQLGAYATNRLNGRLDEVRITKGVARYTANFTPPTEPFPNTATPPPQAHASAPTPLGAPAALAASIRQAWAYAASPLGAPAILAASGENFFARAAAATPLGTPLALTRAVGAARVATAGPLGAGAALGQLVAVARAAASGPLGAASVVARIPILATASAPSVLGQAGVLAYHDFTVGLGDAVTLYVMDLITPMGTVRVPISSWQATLQTGSSNYVQCVIPACTVWQSAINAATEFVVSRRAVLPSGMALEQEMARAPAEQAQFDRGPLRHTCTLSGYSTAFAANANPPAIYDRALTGVRSISSGASNYRARCAVDWLLRPGHRAFVDGVPFIVSYINYYAPSGFDSYMDVGS
jgi:hypothetical protein